MTVPAVVTEEVFALATQLAGGAEEARRLDFPDWWQITFELATFVIGHTAINLFATHQ